MRVVPPALPVSTTVESAGARNRRFALITGVGAVVVRTGGRWLPRRAPASGPPLATPANQATSQALGQAPFSAALASVLRTLAGTSVMDTKAALAKVKVVPLQAATGPPLTAGLRAALTAGLAADAQS